MRRMYTHDELTAMKHKLDQAITDTLREHPDARPLPPMTESEARDMLQTLFDTATMRTLTPDEGFLMGQLLADYRMAVEARMLGYKGRYFVINEADISRLNAEVTE